VPSDLTGPTETATLMMRLLAGAWTARVIHAAAELGLADHFSENASDAASLAAVTDTHPPSLARLLRALAAIGIVHEDEKRRYTLTPLGIMLRTDEPGSMRAWARVILGDELDRAWQALPHAIRTGENTFYNVFGTDLWSYFSTHLDRSNLLNAAMQSLTQGVNAAVGTHYPFGNFGWVVDVGGGDGALLLPILARQPAMRGTIFELPHVAAAARERIAVAGLTSRCDVVEGNALAAITPGADAYVLKHVIHAHRDAEAIAILRNCRAAMPPQAKLLLVERLLAERISPDDAVARPTFLADLNMMLVSGGCERTEAEYRALLDQAGLRLARVVRPPSQTVIIEADSA
jgi:orsellinic acid C2-O-methyltransferase